jgi:hypothetical protein
MEEERELATVKFRDLELEFNTKIRDVKNKNLAHAKELAIGKLNYDNNKKEMAKIDKLLKSGKVSAERAQLYTDKYETLRKEIAPIEKVNALLQQKIVENEQKIKALEESKNKKEKEYMSRHPVASVGWEWERQVRRRNKV